MGVSEEFGRHMVGKYEQAVMERTNREIGDLTGEEIVTESCKIFWSNRPLLWFNVPKAIFTACFVFALLYYMPADFDVFGPPDPRTQQLQNGDISIFREMMLPYVPPMLVIVIGLLPMLAIGALQSSANVYAVGLVFTDRAVTFRSLLDGVTRSLPRMVVTLLCAHLVMYLVMLSSLFLYTAILVFSISFLSLRHFFMMQIAIVVTLLLAKSSISFFAIRFQLAYAVSVFEEISGWAALRRAKQLLEEKKIVALRSEGTYLGRISAVVLVFLFCYNFATHPNDPWNLLGILLIISVSVLGAYIQQMYSISAGVAYVSFKAYHETNVFTTYSAKDVADEIERGLLKYQSPLAPEEQHALIGKY